jgi:hypothetical protein
MRRPITLAMFLAMVRAFVADNLTGEIPGRVRIDLHSGDKFTSKVPVCDATPTNGQDEDNGAFVPNALQQGILDALEGKALRTDALGAKVGDKRRLYHAGGIKELRDRGLVELHPRLGYWRPDAPPPELAGEP